MKNNFTAYLLWFLLGGLGIHAFYCKKNKLGLVYLAYLRSSTMLSSV